MVNQKIFLPMNQKSETTDKSLTDKLLTDAELLVRSEHDGLGNLQAFYPELGDQEKLKKRLQQIKQRDDALIGVFITDLEGQFLKVSQSLCELLDYSADELLCLSYRDITRFNDLETYLLMQEKLLLEQLERCQLSQHYVRKDGEIVHVIVSLYLMHNAENMPLCFISRFEDISDRQPEQQIEFSEKSSDRYRLLFESNPYPMWIYDTYTLEFLAVNDAAVSHYGYSISEFLTVTVAHIQPLEKAARNHDLLGSNRDPLTTSSSKDDLDFAGIIFHRKKDGTLIYVEATSHPLIFEGREAEIVLIHDVTEQKSTEEALRQAEEKYRSIFENAVEGIFQTTEDGHYLTANPMLAKIYGYDSVAELMNSITDIANQLYVTPKRRQEFMRLLQEKDVVGRFESQIYRKDGNVIWISENARAIRDRHGKLLGYEGTVEDITEYKRVEEELKLLQSLTLAISTSEDFNSALGIALQQICETTGWLFGEAWIPNLSDVNPHLECCPAWFSRNQNLSGFRQLSLEIKFAPNSGLPGRVWSSRQPEWLQDLTKAVDPRFNRHQLATQFGLKSGLGIPILAGDEVVAVMVFFMDRSRSEETRLIQLVSTVATQLGSVIQRKRAEARIKHLAFHDSLTDLPNRALFKDRLNQLLMMADRQLKQVDRKSETSPSLAVMFLDLDRFKFVNDTLGHATGDLLLQAVAKRLNSCIRRSDTLARMGGDEFMILLPDIHQADYAIAVTKKILKALESPFLISNQDLHITASIGISFYPHDGRDAETLLKNADVAMYRAKEQGRNHYQLYTRAMNARAFEHIVIEKGIRRAIAQEEFRVYYQPQVDLYSGQIIGMEALVRWQHPDLGLVAPANFIPIAEEYGLIVQLGEWVLRTACAQNKAWQNAGLPPIPIAINFSARQFQEYNLAARVFQVLADTGLDPNYLELEITESVMMKDEDIAIETLRQLKDRGVHISIDDFGTGYSSLSHLKRFPVEKLKIDASFIREITTDNDDAAITTAIIAMAHSLKLKVIAEGVETVGQLKFLRSLKCDAMQGYLFSPAIPADEVTKMLFEVRYFL